MSRTTRAALLAVSLAFLWGRALAAGFWLDECATVYVVKDGLAETIARARELQGQSPLYFAIAWAARATLGTSELALRLPSLVFMSGALALTARLGRKLIDGEAGYLAALFLACATAHEAIDARPYALAILAVVAAALAARRWSESRTWRDALVTAGALALIAWAHPLHVLAWPAVFLLGRPPLDRPLRGALAQTLVIVLVTALLVSPLVPQLVALHGRRAQLAFAATPRLLHLLEDLVRPRVVIAIGVGVVLARLRGPVRVHVHALRSRRALPALLVWHVLPLVALFLVSRLGDASLYVARYHACALPGLALLFAWAVRGLEPVRARALVAAVLVALSLVRYHEREDWRAAVETVRAHRGDALVLLRPGLVESDDPSWLRDPARRDYLLAPLAAYPLSAEVRLVPRELTRANEGYVDELVRDVTRRDHLILVARSNAPIRGWLERRLGVAGLASRTLSSARERIAVTAYDRR